jgi:hypothetical protein
VMIGIAGQDKAVGQGFDLLGCRLMHARRVPGRMSGFGT